MLFRTMIFRSRLSVTLVGFVFLIGMSGIQTQVSGETGESVKGKLSPQELEKLVGPIALYPDELVGIVLPASTNALQVVSAARFLQKQKKDSSLKPDENWDPSVLGLLNYPEVINLMNQDLEWTQNLGDAVINHQNDVMDAIQQFRAKAEAAGNLKSNDKQVIVVEKEVIKIVSADPQVIYVPTYQPTTVIYQTTPVYYSSPYPVYYSPGAAFFTGMFVGAAISYGVGWRRGGGDINVNRNVNINTGGRGGAGRPSQRPAGGRGGGGQKWNPSQGSRQRSAARTQPAQRPGGGGRAGGRGTPSARTGQQGRGGGQQARAGTSARTGQQGRGGGQSRPGSQPSRSGGRSSFSGYKSGSTARANSSRGSQSRASSSRSRSSSSRSSASRSRGSSRGGSRGGGRSRGGGGGRRR